MADLTPEQIAAIATQAALAAVAAATGGAQAPSVPAAMPEEEDDDAVHKAEIERGKIEARERQERIDALVAELLPLIMQPRHMEVFRWISGDAWATTLTQILRAEVARRTPDWREAHGSGGSSSRNLEALSDRLPRR